LHHGRIPLQALRNRREERRWFQPSAPGNF
jgi:hypothetical protein